MIGMLWFDNGKDDLQKKILRGVEAFTKKFKKVPAVVLMNTVQFEGHNTDELTKACKITVRPFKSVLPHHFWIGFEDEGMTTLGAQQ